MKKINEIIDEYSDDKELYKVLKKYYINEKISQEKYDEIVKNLKKTIVSYYLYKYEFTTYQSGKIQEQLVNKISIICDFKKKVKFNNGKIKVYPVKESNENKKKIYTKIIKQMVDYKIETNMDIEEIFNIFTNLLDGELNKYKQKLKESDMHLYYGSLYYIIERSKYIIECINKIPNISLDLNEIKNTIIKFEKKYLDDREDTIKGDDFIASNDEFYQDYDLIESCYKKLLIIENDLAPIVAKYWKQYLTYPDSKNDSYRYITHSFSGSMVDPNLMDKACCSLSTSDITNYMYGNCGLIYDMDIGVIDTMCTDDAGSWLLSKDEFIEREMPGNWQLTKLDEQCIWYEYPKNSKIIMPEEFEKECKEKNSNKNFWHYSEIVMNKNAKPIGVFYTDECQNLEEVELYAKKFNLPLVKIKTKTNNIGGKKI